MGTALRILLIIVLIWYVVRLIDRFILSGGGKQKDQAPPGKKEKEFKKSTKDGDVTITDYGKRSKNVNPENGEYTDYEEIE
jgi:hypothetical protein